MKKSLVKIFGRIDGEIPRSIAEEIPGEVVSNILEDPSREMLMYFLEECVKKLLKNPWNSLVRISEGISGAICPILKKKEKVALKPFR